MGLLNDPFPRRVVEPEILDGLDPSSREARRNRRDLRRLNALMGNFGWFAQRLREAFPRGGRFLEIGAGDGGLGRFLKRSLPGTVVEGLDLWPRPAEWPADWGWHRENVVTFDRYDAYDAVLCNLILHQFEDPVLVEIGGRILRAGVPMFVVEPCRKVFPYLAIRLTFPFVGSVTRHDAPVSIRAGFRRGEVGRILGIPDGIETESPLGTLRWMHHP